MQGVVYLHTRTPPFVHGDIKPTNIVIDDSGIPKLCDFGLSRIFREASDPPTGLTTTTAYTGTSRYLAIELVDPNEIVTPTLKTDIWALGCVGLNFIFREDTYANRATSLQIFEDIRKGVPPTKFPDDIATEYQGIAKILDDCWARIPSERPDALTLTGKMLKFFPTCANKQPVSEVHSTIPQNIITGFSGAIREEKIAASSDLGIPVSIPIEHKGRIFEDNGSSSSRGNTNTISVGNDPGSLRSKVHHGYRLARLDIPRLQSLTFSIPAALNPNPALAMGGRTKKTCKECGQPGRYEGNKCVERWEFSAYGPSTVCEQCHKINWWLEKWGNQKAQAGTAKKHNRHPRSPTLSISSSRSSDQHSGVLDDSESPWRRPDISQQKYARVTGQPKVPSLSYRQLLQQRLQKYHLSSTIVFEERGPLHARIYKGIFSIGRYKVGHSEWHDSKGAAKEHAAGRALTWMDQYGYI